MLKPLISITYDEFCREYAKAMADFIKGFPPGIIVKNELAIVGSIMASELFDLDMMINQDSININHQSFCETNAKAISIAYTHNPNLVIIEEMITTLGGIMAANLFTDGTDKEAKIFEFRKRD